MPTDGVQDRLPQSMAPWHIGYFKLKKFEKMTEEERLLYLSSHTILPTYLPALLPETCLKTLCERDSSYSRRKEVSVSPKTGGHQEESEQIGLAKFPSVYSNSSSNLTKIHRFNHFLSLYFLMEALVSCKTYIK